MDIKRVLFAILAIVILSWFLRYVQNIPTTQSTTTTTTTSATKVVVADPKLVAPSYHPNYNSYKSQYYN